MDVANKTANETAIQRVDRLFAMQQARHLEIGNRKLSERKKDLKKLLKVIMAHRAEIAEAVMKDLRKPAVESDLSEIYPIKSDIKHALAHVDDWAAKKRVSTPLSLMGTKAWVRPEPKGVVLIISPWNFPFNLTFCPLISALAAGNCVILKPSESTPNCAALMQKMINETFDPDHVAVVEGDASVSSKLTSLPFHHIFFTGGPAVGKHVMKAAAENLTSVTLELGGKSPAIVDASANLEDAVRRIVWGRFFNSGQVCISPDYALVEEKIADRFIEKVKEQIDAFYGDPMKSKDLSSLVHDGHFKKMKSFIEDARARGADVVTGASFDESRRFVSPTVLANVSFDMDVMKEEIFGPILPVLTWRSPDDVMNIVNRLERPLAYYVFSKNRRNTRRFLDDSRAGSTAINETFIQFIHPELPFGGVNFSGIGKAHGKYGFDAFSNERSFLKQVFRWNAPRLTYPPYNRFTRKIADIVVKYL